MTETMTPEERVAALERQLETLQQAHRSALMQGSLREAALRAGMIDLDGLKLIDTVGLATNESGEVEDPGALMTTLKRTKPWLFGFAGASVSGASSSSAASAPPAQPPKARRATDMTYEEWQTARAELLRRL